jgi:hypothetical protein
MTDDFEDIVTSAADSTGFYAAVQEASAELLREHPGGVDVVQIGHRAWKQLTPVQQAHALDGLFRAYVVQVGEEERAAQLDQAAADVKTYLEADDEYLLSNVWDALALLRHRLAMAKKGEGQ